MTNQLAQFSSRMFLKWLAVAALLMLSAPAIFAQTPSVLAIVNGDSITTDMLVDELGRIHAQNSGAVQRAAFSTDALIRKLINNQLIAQDARALELDKEPAVARPVSDFREALVYPLFLKTLINDSMVIPASEIDSLYRDQYRVYALRLICVNDSNLCGVLFDSIRAGNSMADIAKRHSLDRYKDQGGAGADFPLVDLPFDLQPRLRKAQIGDLFGPQYLWKVWTLIRLEAIREADPARRDSLNDALTKLAKDLRRRARRAEIADSMRAYYPVHVDSLLVDSVIVLMQAGLPADDRPVITVGTDRKLTARELRNKYIHRIAGRSDREARIVLYEVVSDQVNLMLLKSAAANSAIMNDPDIHRKTTEFEDSLLVNYYLDELVVVDQNISEDSVRAFYENNPERFRKHGRMRIATLTQPTAAEADSAYARLQAGTEFAYLTRKISTDEVREQAGLRDWMEWGSFPASWQAMLDTAQIGTILPPVKVDAGYWIIKVQEREPANMLAFDLVHDQIRNALREQHALSAIENVVAELRGAAKITIFDDALRDLQISGTLEP